MAEMIYFNFPIQMLDGIWNGNSKTRSKFMSDILYFHIVRHSYKLPDFSDYREPEELFLASADYWGVNISGGIEGKLNRGNELIEAYEDSKVFVGLNNKTYWDYRNSPKDEFDWQQLLFFLALKSIVGNKPYCKTDNALLYSRAQGFEAKMYTNDLHITDYRRQKIITALETNWNLKYYSRHTRGFYFGFNIELEKLIFAAENRKEENRKKIIQQEKELILEKWKKQNRK